MTFLAREQREAVVRLLLYPLLEALRGGFPVRVPIACARHWSRSRNRCRRDEPEKRAACMREAARSQAYSHRRSHAGLKALVFDLVQYKVEMGGRPKVRPQKFRTIRSKPKLRLAILVLVTVVRS